MSQLCILLRHYNEYTPERMDSESFRQQILPVYQRMFAVALRMFDGNRDNAYDAVQDTIAALWERRRELQISVSPEALCITAVRNRCISLLRARRMEASIDDYVNVAARDDADSDTERVYMAVNLLPESRRTAVRMSMKGFDHHEIASELGTTEGNVRQLLSRGRNQLKEILSHI